MKTGVLQIDVLTLNETNVVQDSISSSGTDVGRTLSVAGQETSCETSTIDILKSNVIALYGRTVPVQFQYKSSYNGYYVVTNATIAYEKWFNGSTVFQWNLTIVFIGPDNAVDIEARLANIARANDFSLTGERWHAPNIGHTTYYIGATTPTAVTRTTSNGAISVYRSIPSGIFPRWGSAIDKYIVGRVSFFINSTEVISARNIMGTTGWELNNGLVRVKPATSATTTLLIAFYDGTTWRERAWDVRFGGTVLDATTALTSVTILRIDHEVAVVRIFAAQPTSGNRVIIDLLLRRGARFIEGQIQCATSSTIAVTQDVTDAVTDNTSYVISSSADANGLKMVVGSARNFDPDSNGGISLTSTTFLDFFIGATIGTPSSGDAATDLRNQYIGAMPETTEVVRR